MESTNPEVDYLKLLVKQIKLHKTAQETKIKNIINDIKD